MTIIFLKHQKIKEASCKGQKTRKIQKKYLSVQYFNDYLKTTKYGVLASGGGNRAEPCGVHMTVDANSCSCSV